MRPPHNRDGAGRNAGHEAEAMKPGIRLSKETDMRQLLKNAKIYDGTGSEPYRGISCWKRTGSR